MHKCRVSFCLWIDEDKEFYQLLRDLKGRKTARVLKQYVVAGINIPAAAVSIPDLGIEHGKAGEIILWMDSEDFYERAVVNLYKNSMHPSLLMRTFAFYGWRFFTGKVTFGNVNGNIERPSEHIRKEIVSAQPDNGHKRKAGDVPDGNRQEGTSGGDPLTMLRGLL